MKNRRKIKGEQNLQYILIIRKKNDDFDILNDISGDVSLVQFMDSLVNVNHSISSVGYGIFDPHYKKALCLTLELLDIIFSTSIDKELVANFYSVFYTVVYIWHQVILKNN